MTAVICAVTSKEIEKLKTISETTFTETFAKDNTPADLAYFFAKNYNILQLKKELANEKSAKLKIVEVVE